MEFDVVFAPEHNVLGVRVWGAGGPNLVEEMVTAIRSAPDFDPGIGVLIDALGTDYVPSTREAMSIPGLFEAQLPGSRLALIVRDGSQYNVACVVEAEAPGSSPCSAIEPKRSDGSREARERVDRFLADVIPRDDDLLLRRRLGSARRIRICRRSMTSTD